MKCEHCGSNLNIEDKVCPFCGSPNPFAQQHQKEMEKFSKDYRKTKEDVLEQSTRFNKRVMRATILAVLVALCAVMAVLCFKADDIRWWRMEKDIQAQAGVHTTQLDELMEMRDYLGFEYYYQKNGLSYTDSFREYDAAADASWDYRRFYEDLLRLLARNEEENVYTYYSEEELLADIAKDISALYQCLDEESYRFSEGALAHDKVAYIEDAIRSMEALVQAYFGISAGEASGMRSMTPARIEVMLEDAYVQD